MTLHVTGHSVDDGETTTLIQEMYSGRDNFKIMISDDSQNLTWGQFSMNVTRFVSQLPAATDGGFRGAVLINEESDGIQVGHHRFRALVCDSEGSAQHNCEFVESLPADNSTGGGRNLMDDNEMIVYTTGIGVIGAVTVVCIVMCGGPVTVAAAGVTVAASCFPSSAMVLTPGGAQSIKSVAIGALLLTSQGYAPVFLHGHQDGAAYTQMVRLVTGSNHTLTLTADHYLPLAGGGHASAGRISVGDELLVQHGDGFVPSAVVSLDSVWEEGLWNPYTTTGDLVVGGVLASSHSSWFLEGAGLPQSHIVRAYQALLAPLGLLHRVAPGWLSRFAAAYEGDRRSLSEVSAVDIVGTAWRTLLHA
mmetsp:Transcript_4319/g.12231  ORF Transcript_4319/g.12231 Transcript_4319/m.12231 type:complete len:362 (-) Transcript_4319:370-1455(-)